MNKQIKGYHTTGDRFVKPSVKLVSVRDGLSHQHHYSDVKGLHHFQRPNFIKFTYPSTAIDELTSEGFAYKDVFQLIHCGDAHTSHSKYGKHCYFLKKDVVGSESKSYTKDSKTNSNRGKRSHTNGDTSFHSMSSYYSLSRRSHSKSITRYKSRDSIGWPRFSYSMMYSPSPTQDTYIPNRPDQPSATPTSEVTSLLSKYLSTPPTAGIFNDLKFMDKSENIRPSKASGKYPLYLYPYILSNQVCM